MSKIAGIRLRTRTSSTFQTPASDAYFLGLFGRGGGREYRIRVDGDKQFSKSDLEQSFVIGSPCCKPMSDDIPVVALPDNTPDSNPVSLESVEYVYLRRQRDGKSENSLVIDLAEVMLCDKSGGLKRFRKKERMRFSEESGLQHYLKEVTPPQCSIEVRLDSIEHEDSVDLPEGFSWLFSGRAVIDGIPGDLVTNRRVSINQDGNSEDWVEPLDMARVWTFIGCCGSTYSVDLLGSAVEQDYEYKQPVTYGAPITGSEDNDGTHRSGSRNLVPIFDDETASKATIKVTSVQPPISKNDWVSQDLVFYMDDRNNIFIDDEYDRRSKITFHYRVVAVYSD